MIRHLLGGALAALLAIGGGPAGAQDYPSKTIKIISPSAPGGLTDIVARLIGERLSQNMKVTVVVENRPGGTGAVALDLVAKAPPDGYTLVVGFAGANVIYPLLNDKLPLTRSATSPRSPRSVQAAISWSCIRRCRCTTSRSSLPT